MWIDERTTILAESIPSGGSGMRFVLRRVEAWSDPVVPTWLLPLAHEESPPRLAGGPRNSARMAFTPAQGGTLVYTVASLNVLLQPAWPGPNLLGTTHEQHLALIIWRAGAVRVQHGNC